MDALTPSSLTYPGRNPEEDGWLYSLNTLLIRGTDRKIYLNDQDLDLFKTQPDFDTVFEVLQTSAWVRL